MKSLVWFRSDIRMDDNPALREACANYSEVHAIYLYSPKQLNAHNESNVKIDFLIQNLTILNNNLNKFNIPLTVLESDGFDNDSLLIKDISIERQIDKVFWNNQIGEDEQARDRKTIEFLSKINIEHESFFDQVVYEPGTLKTGQGGPYSVFTPFKRKWIENFDMDFLDINFKYEIIYFYNVYGPRQIRKGRMATVIGIFENKYKDKFSCQKQ